MVVAAALTFAISTQFFHLPILIQSIYLLAIVIVGNNTVCGLRSAGMYDWYAQNAYLFST